MLFELSESVLDATRMDARKMYSSFMLLSKGKFFGLGKWKI